MKKINIQKTYSLVSALVISVFTFILLGSSTAKAAALTAGTVTPSDSRPTQGSVSYTIDFSSVTTSTTRCIKMVFATTTTGSTVPSGMTTTGAGFSGTSDYVPTPASWTVGAGVNGTVTLTYATGESPASASARTVVLTGITNGSTADTPYYLQFSTFSNTDCSTGPLDTGTLAFIFTTGQVVTVSVDPSLAFSLALVNTAQAVNGATTTVQTTTSTVPFGRVTASTNAIAAHDLTVTTNAGTGYTIYTRYTGALASGTPTISDLSGATNSAPTAFSAAGTEAFGYTTNDSSLGTGTPDRFTSSGGNKWAAFTTSNAEVAYSNAAVSSQTTRVGYQVGIAGTTEALTYTTTIIYTAVPLY